MSSRIKKDKQAITLKGSAKIVTEFFEFGVNNILYQRGIYPDEDFKMVKKYGLTLLVTSDEKLEAYIRQIMSQVSTWIQAGNISRIVMAITSKETRATLERWQFDIQVDKPSEGKENSVPNGSSSAPVNTEKSLDQVQSEIRDIMRNITSTVAFLPSLQEKCLFNILAYTDQDASVPQEWVDSDAHMIQGNAEQVKFRSFSTNFHKVEALVAYRLGSDAV